MLSSFLKSLVSIVTLASTAPRLVNTACVVFDSNFNLYALGFEGKDFLLGTQDLWNSSITPKDITASGRPSFDGKQPTCYLSQFENSIYVLNGDSSDPSSVSIFDAAGGTWSTQKVQPGGPNPDTLVAILDHDTNTYYAVDNGTITFLDLGQEKVANNTPLAWVIAESTPYGQAYVPTMALAQNHIHFIDTPDAQPGTADIYVIHFDSFQTEPQAYPDVNGGSPFPETHGQTASIFKSDSVQENFAFIPDSADATYIINVQNNNTVTLAGPTDKSESTYTASLTALVQLTSNGSIFFITFNPDNIESAKGASWNRIVVEGLPSLNNTSSTSSGSNGNNSSASSGSSGSGESGGSGSSSSGSSGSESGSSNGCAGSSVYMPVVLIGALLCYFTL